ncbi:MAG: HgcAB-associated protein [bacterium]
MKKKKENKCSPGPTINTGCCTVTSVVTIDEKGQMVLPKDVRNAMGINAGDKLAVVSVGHEQDACCLMLMKANALDGMVKIKIDTALKGKGVKDEER